MVIPGWLKDDEGNKIIEGDLLIFPDGSCRTDLSRGIVNRAMKREVSREESEKIMRQYHKEKILEQKLTGRKK